MPSLSYKEILVTGGEGALGSYFRNCTRLTRRDLDIENERSVFDTIARHKPKVIIHLAAITDVRLCENDPKRAKAVNAMGTRYIAEAARLCGARVAYVSTNAVFDGTKDGAYLATDTTHPISEYGKTKHEGELAVLEANRKNLVIRSSWIFGGGPSKDKKFVGKVVPLLRKNAELRAVDDVWGTPTYGKDLANAIIKLVEKGSSGIVHIVNFGKASRYDMAVVARDVLESQSKVQAVPQSAFIAAGSALKNEMLDPKEHALRPWQEALKEYLETEWK